MTWMIPMCRQHHIRAITCSHWTSRLCNLARRPMPTLLFENADVNGWQQCNEPIVVNKTSHHSDRVLQEKVPLTIPRAWEKIISNGKCKTSTLLNDIYRNNLPIAEHNKLTSISSTAIIPDWREIVAEGKSDFFLLRLLQQSFQLVSNSCTRWVTLLRPW